MCSNLPLAISISLILLFPYTYINIIWSYICSVEVLLSQSLASCTHITFQRTIRSFILYTFLGFKNHSPLSNECIFGPLASDLIILILEKNLREKSGMEISSLGRYHTDDPFAGILSGFDPESLQALGSFFFNSSV